MNDARLDATILAAVVADALAQLDEVRLPLQILLEAPFGELNENQEELLRDARAAADGIDTALRRLAQVADIDRGLLSVQRELVQVNDVVRSVLPLMRAAAERRGARASASLEPGLPRVMADRARLAEALALLSAEVTDAAEETAPVSVTTSREGNVAVIRLAPLPEVAGDVRATTILASRLIEAQGGELRVNHRTLELRIGGSTA